MGRPSREVLANFTCWYFKKVPENVESSEFLVKLFKENCNDNKIMKIKLKKKLVLKEKKKRKRNLSLN